MDETNKLFGRRLRQLRRRANLTQGQLGVKAGIHSTYISMVESGRANISLDKITILASCLGVSVNDFFSQDLKSDSVSCKEYLKNINSMLQRLKPAQVRLVQEIVRELSSNSL